MEMQLGIKTAMQRTIRGKQCPAAGHVQPERLRRVDTSLVKRKSDHGEYIKVVREIRRGFPATHKVVIKASVVPEVTECVIQDQDPRKIGVYKSSLIDMKLLVA